MNEYKPYRPTKWERRIDDVIRVVAPRLYHERVVARERTCYFRYLAALPNSARTNTNPSLVGETQRGLREKLQVMWNAINMVENSGLCTSLLNKFMAYVCGTLRWQSRCGVKAIANQYEDYMRLKCGKGLDFTGRSALRQQIMLDIKGIMLKGDIGCNVVRVGRDLYLQGIEAERIGNPYDWTARNDYVRGLHLNQYGIIDAADIFYRDRMSSVFKFDQTIPMHDEQGMPRFLFLVNPISYDDYRGVSVFKTAIDNATYIDRMREYELQALLWAASQSGIFHTKSGTLPEQLPFDTLKPLHDLSGNQINTFQVRPNTVTAIGVGEDVSMFQHDRPSPNVVNMFRDTIRDICTGVGISFELGWDMSGLSGPAVRDVSAQDARVFETWQQLLLENKLDIVAGLLIGNAIAEGILPYTEKWDRWQWFFPAKKSIDAGRESVANIAEIAAGLNTAANITAEASLDVGEVNEQRARETADKIEQAMEVAKLVQKEGGEEITWREIYNYMWPAQSKQPGSPFGGMAVPFGSPKADRRDVTTDGVDVGSNGDGSRDGGDGNGTRMRSNQVVLVVKAADPKEVFYREDQARDEHGRFEDEGQHSMEKGHGHLDLGSVTVTGSADGRFTGEAKVKVIHPHSNISEVGYSDTTGRSYTKTGKRHIGKMLVELDRSKRGLPPLRFEVYHHQVRYRSDEEMEIWYREDQERDEKGRFADEGKGGEAAPKEEKPKEAPPAEKSGEVKEVSHPGSPGSAEHVEALAAAAEYMKDPRYQEVQTKLDSLLPRLEGESEKDHRTRTESWSYNLHVDENGVLSPERQALHTEIVNKQLNPKAAVPEGQRPRAVFLIGQPGSGKSTKGLPYAKEMAGGEATVINPDEIRGGLPEYKGWNAAATQYESKVITKQVIGSSIASRHNVVFDETGSNSQKMLDRMEDLSKAGYDVGIVNVSVPLKTSVDRAMTRFYGPEGRFVDLRYLLDDVDGNPAKSREQLKSHPATTLGSVNVDNRDFKNPAITDERTKLGGKK